MTESVPIPATSPGLPARVIVRFATAVVFAGVLLFGSAGSFRYWNGWLFMGALFIPMILAIVTLYRKHRALLEKRLKRHEPEKEQRRYTMLSYFWLLTTCCIPGLDYRFGWSLVPLWLVVASVIVMMGGYAMFMTTMVQNRFASGVVEVQENQHVVDTGLYSVVRHPMYTAACIIWAASPLVLGSYYALIPAGVLPFLLVYRLQNEEKVLEAGLAGYVEYKQRVRFRLIPFVW